jgi:hypothetical protein
MTTTSLNPARVPSAPVPCAEAIAETSGHPSYLDPAMHVEDSSVRALPIEEVRAEAYRLFLGRGAEDGHDVDDWLAAEEMVRQKLVEPAQD